MARYVILAKGSSHLDSVPSNQAMRRFEQAGLDAESGDGEDMRETAETVGS